MAEAKDPVESHTLRRGNLFINDVREEGSESEGEEGGEEDEMGEGDAERITEVKWAIPSWLFSCRGAVSAVIGEHVYLPWEKYGWQLGKITHVITADTRRLFKKVNFRIVWADRSKGPCKLDAKSYASGTSEQYSSWVVLRKS